VTSTSTHVFCAVAAVRSSAADVISSVIVMGWPPTVTPGASKPVTANVPVPA
jgi:hypothetical protein